MYLPWNKINSHVTATACDDIQLLSPYVLDWSPTHAKLRVATRCVHTAGLCGDEGVEGNLIAVIYSFNLITCVNAEVISRPLMLLGHLMRADMASILKLGWSNLNIMPLTHPARFRFMNRFKAAMGDSVLFSINKQYLLDLISQC